MAQPTPLFVGLDVQTLAQNLVNSVVALGLIPQSSASALVSTLVRPSGGRTCDADSDGDIDLADGNLIVGVRGLLVPAGDPRDPNRDGIVNALDARICTTQIGR